MKKLVLVLFAALGLAALPVTPAHALAFPGLSVIDTEYNCHHANSGFDECYTWIRTNGVLRRGSAAEYFTENSGGFVLVVCSSAKWHPNKPADPYNKDWNGVTVSPHFHWLIASNHPYCQSPVLGAGYPWTGYRWNQVPNPAPY